MIWSHIQRLLLRGFLPIILLGCTVVRFNGFSFVYLLMLLICPLLRYHNQPGGQKPVKAFLIVLILISSFFTLSNVAVNVSIIFLPDFLSNCNFISFISPINYHLTGTDRLTGALHQLGIVNVHGIKYSLIARVILPDLVALVISIILLVLLYKMNSRSHEKPGENQTYEEKFSHVSALFQSCENNDEGEADKEEVIIQRPNLSKPKCIESRTENQNQNSIQLKPIKSHRCRKVQPTDNYMRKTLGIDELHNTKLRHWATQSLFAFFNIVITGFAGIISPSLLNLVYLLSYIGIGTFWACGNNVLTLNFARMRLFVLLYSAAHLCLIFITQLEFMQLYIPTGQLLSRLLGLYLMIDTSCEIRGKFIFSNLRFIDFMSPFVILYVYYLSAIETRIWLEDRKRCNKESPLMDKETFIHTESYPSEVEINQEQSQIISSSCNVALESNASIGPFMDFSGVPHVMDPQGSRSTLFIEEDITKDNEEDHVKERPLFLSIVNTMISNSFILTFMAMMAWSVAYKSWASFIFLLCACYLWITPHSRVTCLYSSPVIVAYATLLILIQYIYGLNLPELPTTLKMFSSEMQSSEIGLHRWLIPTGPLAVMMSFLVVFWLTLRLFMTDERINNRKDVNEKTSTQQKVEYNFGNVDNATYEKFVKCLKEKCENYWIFACCSAMLFVSVNGSIVLFRIVYMVLLVYFLLVFMLSYSFWRKQMKVFWWIVIGYNVFGLLSIYVFQFQRISMKVQNITGLSEEILRDIGLKRFPASDLLQSLFTPVIFLVILIVQVRYFHSRFLELTSMKQPKVSVKRDNEEVKSSKDEVDKNICSAKNPVEFIRDVNIVLSTATEKLKYFYFATQPLIWRFWECHFTKFLVILIVYVCIIDVHAMNIILILIIVIGFPFPRLHTVMVNALFICSASIVILKMIYQIKIFQTFNWLTNCSQYENFLNSSVEIIDNAKWLGLEKLQNFQLHILKWTIVLIGCAVWHIIRYHQMQFYKFNVDKKPKTGIIFQEVDIHSSIEDFWDLVKYSLNFAFHKIGLELSFVCTVVVSCLRIDIYSLAYLLLLLLFLVLKRDLCNVLWLPYIIFLGILLPVQYAFCVGLPQGLCIEYPLKLIPRLRQWLYLPNYKVSPVPGKILADFVQFIFVVLQYQVFQMENRKKSDSNKFTNQRLLEGVQKSIHRDFVSKKSSYADYLKHVVFYWSYWFTLAIIFTTGVFWITLFGLGYLLIAFIYFWMGQNVLIGKPKSLIRSCNVILYYNFLVIITKCTFQLMGCVFMNLLKSKGLCWMVSLFAIQCINPMSWEIRGIHGKADKQCSSVASGLHWDVICFFFIILQRMIFMADPFLLVKLDLHVQNKFSSRGAYLINLEIMKSIEKQKVLEEKELNRIERRIKNIEQRQEQHGKPELNDHYLVMRSGDYYLFQEDSEEDETENVGEFNSSKIDSEMSLAKSNPSNSRVRKDSRVSIASQIYFEDDLNSLNKHLNENLIKQKSTEIIVEKNEQKDEKSEADDLSPIGTLNPLQLINAVVKEGPKRAIRKYRMSVSSAQSNSHLRVTLDMSPNDGESNILENLEISPPEEIRENSFHLSPIHDNSTDFTQHQNLHLPTPIPSENETHFQSSHNTALVNTSNKSSIIDDSNDNQKLESNWKNFKNVVKLCVCFIESIMASLTTLFDGWTQEYYRNIRKLEKEKKLVKSHVLSTFIKIDEKLGKEIEKIVNDENIVLSVSENKEEKNKEKVFRRTRSKFFSLLISFGKVAIIYSEFGCYFLLIMNHLLSGNLLSLPYPFLVFFWGMLSVPRPSKNFWIVLITYTEVVIVLKYIFQFNLIKINVLTVPEHRIDPLALPLILGVEKSRNYAIIDVIQLLFLFLHRSYLKDNGLWRDHSELYDDIKISNKDEDYPDQTLSPQSPMGPGMKFLNKIKQLKRFYGKMRNRKLNKRVDVYSMMFLCEFAAMLIIILGYFSFGPGTDSGGHAIDFIKTNKTPVPFIAMIITQFVFFIIDRALFLRKQVKGKFIFQIFHVILIHAWLFFALPYITKRRFNSQFPPQLLYFIKCIYFALSSYQMKSGYPMRILGNFLTRNYNYGHLFLFKMINFDSFPVIIRYMGIPFLYELRNVMDWMWTDSAVAFYHWMEVEDIFSKIFVLKCWRYGETIWLTERGKNRRLIVKYSLGLLILIFLFLCIWGPLMISSFIGITFVKYPPIECTFSINVGDYSPLFVFSSRENNMKPLTKKAFLEMKECHKFHLPSKDYLQSFEPDDATRIIIDHASDNVWLITPPGLKKLKEKLSIPKASLKINMQAVCERPSTDSKSTEKIVRFTQSRFLTNSEKSNVLHSINGKSNSTNVYLPTIFPRFLTAYKRTLSEASSLHHNENNTYLNISISMKTNNGMMWWEVTEIIQGQPYCSNPDSPSNKYPFLTIFIFNERISDNIFGHIFSSYGILGIYAAYFFVVHRFLRTFYSNISYIIPAEELPNVDRIHKLLHEIYLVRENKKLRLEEQLIAKLIFLYRSTETMIKWTQHKKSTLEAHQVKRVSVDDVDIGMSILSVNNTSRESCDSLLNDNLSDNSVKI